MAHPATIVQPGTKLLALALVVAACGGSDARERPTHQLVEEVRILSEEGSPERMLTAITGLTVFTDGSIATFHGQRTSPTDIASPVIHTGTSQEHVVRLFDRDGKFVRRIGSMGLGPGEFTSMSQVGSLGDQLWIRDASNQKITHLSRDGRVLRISSASESHGNAGKILIAELGGGRRFVCHRYYPSMEQPDLWLYTLDYDSLVYAVEDSAGQVLARASVVGPMKHKPFLHVSGRMRTVTPQRLAGSAIPMFAPGGEIFGIASDAELWGGKPGQVRITRGGSGNEVTHADIQFPPRRIPRNYIDSISATTRDPAVWRDVYKRKLHVPSHYPVLASALLGRDSSVWVSPVYDGDVWRVIRDGTIEMRVRAPAGVRLWTVSRETVWGVQEDSATGVQSVIRFGVRAMARVD